MINKKKDDRACCEKEAEERERHSRELKAKFHPLQHQFVSRYLRRQHEVRSQASYEENIVEFSTVEGFWVCYCHFAWISSMPATKPNKFAPFQRWYLTFVGGPRKSQ
jgi:hypothetical protein